MVFQVMGMTATVEMVMRANLMMMVYKKMVVHQIQGSGINKGE